MQATAVNPPATAEAARKLFADAQALLKKIIDGKLLTARATYGFFPAGTTPEDEIVVFHPTGSQILARFPMPRQMEDKEVCLSLADFIAPLAEPKRFTDGNNLVPRDYLGAFIVTAGIGTDALAASFEREQVVTPLAAQLLTVGEGSGRLATMAGRAGTLSAREAERQLRTALSLLEPALIALFGGVVMLVAIGILQAVYGVRVG